MPRYGDADSIQWFDVKPNCTFHIINCFEDGDEVIYHFGLNYYYHCYAKTQETNNNSKQAAEIPETENKKITNTTEVLKQGEPMRLKFLLNIKGKNLNPNHSF